ncbi:hypothetical protein TUSST3_15360 [Streptomyces sp. TUS-ST3]|nr:hypothetical protein TUSST3_15360 [Streptomyces sp. TUS-ST3]
MSVTGWAAALAGADPAAELVTDVGDHPGAVPPPEKPVNRHPRGKIRRQSPPLRTIVDDVADAVDDVPARPLLRVSALAWQAGTGRRGSSKAQSATVVSEG